MNKRIRKKKEKQGKIKRRQIFSFVPFDWVAGIRIVNCTLVLEPRKADIKIDLETMPTSPIQFCLMTEDDNA